jgi:ribosomal-protein-alanine N-acetyltransferase
MNKLKDMPTQYFDHYMLRTIKKSDASDMFAYGRLHEVTKTLSWGPMTSLKEAKISINDIFLARPKKGIPIGYAIVDLNTNTMIGTIDFHTKIQHENIVEIGYVIHKDYWNQGIMTKALSLIIKVGFEYYGYDKLMIKHLENNPASGRVIEKNGFTYKRTFPYMFRKVNGILASNMKEYEMTKENYNENKQSEGNI